MWHELSADGVVAIEAKGQDLTQQNGSDNYNFPSDTFPPGKVVDVLESGYMYKQRVLIASRVVVDQMNNGTSLMWCRYNLDFMVKGLAGKAAGKAGE